MRSVGRSEVRGCGEEYLREVKCPGHDDTHRGMTTLSPGGQPRVVSSHLLRQHCRHHLLKTSLS